ncbi:hypothetical protein I5677_12220 [Mobilitalea sibirica]|uniref:YopX protein domain-containing protein n=1 Tax=Mobilitalea sibirica TaxID=1462919 RepID=A0A8J7HE68_9FIRM|nr:YopX family protein [Mobilitalea sibirica]MBH1941659.1 hypothetical protein [Mobilitalea sibirica]
MHREIKFRGRSIDTKEWVYGFLYINSNDGRTFVLVDGDLTEDFTAVVVIPETIGQYIGLKDKNGKEIYEEDIFCHPNAPKYKYVVEWEDGGFSIFIEDTGFKHNYIEVIGNIHENPELISW